MTRNTTEAQARHTIPGDGPLIIKRLIEGQQLPPALFLNLPEPWSGWAGQLVNRRNGRSAGEVWDSILAKMPAKERKTASETVIKAKPDSSHWQDDLRAVLDRLPDQAASQKM